MTNQPTKRKKQGRVYTRFTGLKGQELIYQRFLKRTFKAFYRYMNAPTNAALKSKTSDLSVLFNDEMVEYFYEKINFSIVNQIAALAVGQSEKIGTAIIVKKGNTETTKQADLFNNFSTQAAAIEKASEFVEIQKGKVFEVLDNAMEKRKNDLEEFRNSFLFNNKDKEAAFREKYREPKFAFTKTMSRTDINNLNRDLAASKATKLGIKRFEWSTSHDERVRQSHRDLDEKIFEYSNMPLEYNDYNCRCVQIPLVEFDENEDNDT